MTTITRPDLVAKGRQYGWDVREANRTTIFSRMGDQLVVVWGYVPDGYDYPRNGWVTFVGAELYSTDHWNGTFDIVVAKNWLVDFGLKEQS